MVLSMSASSLVNHERVSVQFNSKTIGLLPGAHGRISCCLTQQAVLFVIRACRGYRRGPSKDMGCRPEDGWDQQRPVLNPNIRNG